jgi:anthranilate 1,2-dioxygenase (deaminating, decarboxylating) large subunit
MFTEPELFDLEMEMIFEKNWIYACHESEMPNPNDYITMRAGRQPMIITRDADGASTRWSMPASTAAPP